MRVNFDLVDLQLLIHISEQKGLTGGAERSNLSLPAASLRMKMFEEQVGAKLLYRSKSGAKLTPTGETVLRYARNIMQQLDRLRGELHEHVNGFKGKIRMVANATSLITSLPQVIGRYLTANPNVSVDLREYLSDDGAKAVQDGAADIAIVAAGTRTEGLTLIPYRKEELVVVTAEGHPLTAETAVYFAQTLAFGYVGLSENSALYQFLKKQALALNRTIDLRMQAASFDTICRTIESNVGISVLPMSAARRYSKVMAIRMVQLKDDWSLRQSWICVRDLPSLPLFSRRLIDMLVNED